MESEQRAGRCRRRDNALIRDSWGFLSWARGQTVSVVAAALAGLRPGEGDCSRLIGAASLAWAAGVR